MANINEIAEKVGCSVSTVSKALNGYPHVSVQMREKILAAAKQMGFTPNYFAKGLMSKRSYLTGLYISDHWNSGLLHPLFGGMIEGFKQAVEARNYEVLIIREEYYKSKNFVEHCRQRGIEGVFIVVGNMLEQSMLDLIDSNIPCVSLDLYHDDISTVLPDNGNGGFCATEHLISNGHKKIAHIAGNVSKPAGNDRLNGYKRALQAFGIELDEELIVYTEDYKSTYGMEAMRELLSRKKEFSAVFAASDMLAMGAISHCIECGLKIPDDISVVGFDDIESAAYFNPPLTTMHQSRISAGKRAGEILVDMIEGLANEDCECAPRHIYMPTKLVQRKSVRLIRN